MGYVFDRLISLGLSGVDVLREESELRLDTSRVSPCLTNRGDGVIDIACYSHYADNLVSHQRRHAPEKEAGQTTDEKSEDGNSAQRDDWCIDLLHVPHIPAISHGSYITLYPHTYS